MSSIIRVDGIGKRYRIHGHRERAKAHHRRHHSLLDLARGAVRHVGHGLGLTAADETRDFWALQDISFDINAGEAVGLIGRNGSGKSTLLKILARVTGPTAGSARLRGRVASLLEVGTGFHPELNARQNVMISGTILGMRRAEILRQFDDIVSFAEIEGFIDEPVKHLSSGMYMRLAFAVASFLEAEILLVDEVLAVGDMRFQQKCMDRMREAVNGGRTVLFVSHNLSAVSQFTTRTLVLREGRLIFDGPSEQGIELYLNEESERTAAGRVPTSELDCLEQSRVDDDTLIAEIGLAADQPLPLQPDGSVRVELLVKTTRARNDLRIAYTFLSMSGEALLTGLSPCFALNAGGQVLELKIDSLPLVPGEYRLGFSLGSGQLAEEKREHDFFMGFGRVTVANGSQGTRVERWWPRWSRVLHRNSSVRPLANAASGD